MTQGLAAARRLRADLAHRQEVIVRVPLQPASDLADALLWVRGMVDQGWYVAWQIDEGDVPLVWLKAWEFGEPEPSWSEVRQVPSHPPNDPDGWMADPTFQAEQARQRAEILALTT